MKSYIVKRLKDGQYISLGEKELEATLARKTFNGITFFPEFEFISEEKNIDEEMKELFG